MKAIQFDMLVYYIHLGIRSLKRMPVLTVLMAITIGFGVAASMTSYAVFRAVSGNPIPWKSNQLFVPQVDNWGPQKVGDPAEPPDLLSYTDAMALMDAHAASRQTAIYPVAFSVLPGDAVHKPFAINGYATYADFFSMFEVPFRYGNAWGAEEDRQRSDTVVIGERLNQLLFGGANTVGKQIVLDGHAYRIQGVVADWNPHPRFYDAANANGFASAAPDVFLPFTRAVDLQVETKGTNACNGRGGTGWDKWLRSQCVWISLWVELPDASAVQHYRTFLQGYAFEQQHAGRFNWPPNTRLRNVTEWLDYEHVAPQESKVSLLVSLAFMIVCLVNTVGLLLAKFMRRTGEIGVRRALGASRRQIYVQFLVEAGMVGLAGGVLGLLLTELGMSCIGLLFEPDIARLAHMDPGLFLLTLAVAVISAMTAAFYPTWRAAQVPPGGQLKAG